MTNSLKWFVYPTLCFERKNHKLLHSFMKIKGKPQRESVILLRNDAYRPNFKNLIYLNLKMRVPPCK